MFKFLSEVFYILGENKRKLPLLMLFLLLGSVLDLVGLGLIGPFIGLIINPEIILGNYKKIFDILGLPNEHKPLLVIFGVGLFAIFLLKSLTAIFINYKIIRFCQDQCYYLRSLMMKTLQSIPYKEHVNRNTTEYIHVIQTLSGHFSKGVVMSLLRIASESIVGISILIILVWASGPILSVLVVILGIIVFGYDKIFNKKIKKYGSEINKSSILTVGATQEGMDGFKEIRILSKEDYFHKRVKEGAKKQALFETKNDILKIAPKYILEFLMVSFFVILILGFILLEKDINIILPTIGIFGVAALRLIPSANNFANSLSMLRVYHDSVNRLFKDLNSFKKISKENLTIKESTCKDSFKDLTLSKISFSYPNSNEKTIKDISITLKRGDSIGLIGKSGSGKTTLVDIMLGLLKTQEGVIKYNGRILEESLSSWRSQIAYLPQQVFLIDNTFKSNIALGVEDKKIDENRLQNALERARLTELVEQLPLGVETIVGERGIRISGGQRQRIALARAFYHDREVLVMDEATSSLDHETEKEIVDQIKLLKGEKTLIVIAHRYSTIEQCETIYRIEKGKIVSQGKFENIMKMHK